MARCWQEAESLRVDAAPPFSFLPLRKPFLSTHSTRLIQRQIFTLPAPLRNTQLLPVSCHQLGDAAPPFPHPLPSASATSFPFPFGQRSTEKSADRPRGVRSPLKPLLGRRSSLSSFGRTAEFLFLSPASHFSELTLFPRHSFTTPSSGHALRLAVFDGPRRRCSHLGFLRPFVRDLPEGRLSALEVRWNPC